MKQEILCGFCEGFARDARVFECGHVCCGECAGVAAASLNAVSAARGERAETVEVRCPRCQRGGKLVEDAEGKVRGAIEEIRAKVAERRKCSAIDCKEPVAVKCATCGFLCAAHSASVHAAFRHDVEEVRGEEEEAVAMEMFDAVAESGCCAKHEGVACEFFCKDCGTRICSKCIVTGTHRMHEICDGMSAGRTEEAEKAVAKIAEMKERIEEMAKGPNGREHFEEAKAVVRETCEKAIRALQEEMEKALRMIDEVKEKSEMKSGSFKSVSDECDLMLRMVENVKMRDASGWLLADKTAMISGFLANAETTLSTLDKMSLKVEVVQKKAIDVADMFEVKEISEQPLFAAPIAPNPFASQPFDFASPQKAQRETNSCPNFEFAPIELDASAITGFPKLKEEPPKEKPTKPKEKQKTPQKDSQGKLSIVRRASQKK